MKIVIVDSRTGLLVGISGYTNDVSQALQFTTEADAKLFCSQNTYQEHNIIALDPSKRHGRFLGQC